MPVTTRSISKARRDALRAQINNLLRAVQHLNVLLQEKMHPIKRGKILESIQSHLGRVFELQLEALD